MNHGHQFDIALSAERKTEQEHKQAEREAQKKLEAAAPDLLAACKLALREWYPSLDGCSASDCLVCARHKKENEQVKAAITKAT